MKCTGVTVMQKIDSCAGSNEFKLVKAWNICLHLFAKQLIESRMYALQSCKINQYHDGQ